jgi:hypothetical protein
MRALHGPKARGRRLDGLVCHVVLGCACAAACVGALAFAATRSHAFHVALSRRRQEQANNGWLLEQCQSPQFYSSLRHHSTLCDDVALAQADALWLHALRDVIDETRVRRGRGATLYHTRPGQIGQLMKPHLAPDHDPAVTVAMR